jgi:ribosome-binding protein aMBF1 (putative translation factor)
MSKTNIGRIYTSRTVTKILKKYISEDQRRIDKRIQLATRISNAIEIRGITPKELATRVGKRPSEIKKLLNGQLEFTQEILAKIESELILRLTEG